MPQRIYISAYDPAWERLFEEEAALIRRILGSNLAAIHHIGSTAVPGLCAKPIIDILPVVYDLAAVDRQTDAFAAAGYEARDAGIFARAAIGARISCTSSKKAMYRKSSGTSHSGTICARIRQRRTNMARLKADWPRSFPTASTDTATARTNLSGNWSKPRFSSAAMESGASFSND